MQRRLLAIASMLAALAASGCATHSNQVVMTNLTSPTKPFVVDRTSADDYPGFATGYGNIYSCRYGIRHQPADAYSPPKTDMFAALLADAVPAVTNHRVVLRRFDVYVNERLRSLHRAGDAIGGVAGQLAKEASRTDDAVYLFEKVLIDAEPTVDRHPDENKVGCDDKQEGEYYASEMPAGHDVVVVWLRFNVGDQPYHFRAFYPYQPENELEVTAGITDAIKLTVRGVAQRLEGL